MIEMTVTNLAVDTDSGAVLLVLESDDDRSLIIAIGFAEGAAIAKEIQGTALPRPMTHDLMRNLLDTLGARLEQIEVIDLRDGTYYAELVLQKLDGEECRVDCRPSDAIALALRAEASIFVHEQVLGKANPEAQEFPPPTDKEKWKKLLEEMDPEDFGKYKM
jgi:bifunctional DNase/RNase